MNLNLERIETMTTATVSENLLKAAEHFEEAGKHFRQAAQSNDDNKSDHLLRLGSAHATHAHQHANEAAKEHAVGITAGCCCS
ncbi:MAG: hypothetical protein ACYC8W_11935 [Candidatus Tyrphobacter sp.]